MRRFSEYLSAPDWNPGLDNGRRKLGDVLDTLPGAMQGDIHWLVRLIENPKSPLSLPGQISLERHDALHIILGRGLNNQDEAFVIGFTMGAAASTKPWHCQFFEFIASKFYPKAYRFSNEHRTVFRLGLGQGYKHQVKDVHMIPLETMRDETINAIREQIGINVHDLHAAYRQEKMLFPHTVESQRLDIDYGGVDPSAILPPDTHNHR